MSSLSDEVRTALQAWLSGLGLSNIQTYATKLTGPALTTLPSLALWMPTELEDSVCQPGVDDDDVDDDGTGRAAHRFGDIETEGAELIFRCGDEDTADTFCDEFRRKVYLPALVSDTRAVVRIPVTLRDQTGYEITVYMLPRVQKFEPDQAQRRDYWVVRRPVKVTWPCVEVEDTATGLQEIKLDPEWSDGGSFEPDTFEMNDYPPANP